MDQFLRAWDVAATVKTAALFPVEKAGGDSAAAGSKPAVAIDPQCAEHHEGAQRQQRDQHREIRRDGCHAPSVAGASKLDIEVFPLSTTLDCFLRQWSPGLRAESPGTAEI